MQTKTLCLILNEHEKLTIENPLLKQQINSLEELNQLYVVSDSLQRIEIDNYRNKVVSDDKTIQHLKSSRKKLIFGFSAGSICLFILGLLL